MLWRMWECVDFVAGTIWADVSRAFSLTTFVFPFGFHLLSRKYYIPPPLHLAHLLGWFFSTAVICGGDRGVNGDKECKTNKNEIQEEYRKDEELRLEGKVPWPQSCGWPWPGLGLDVESPQESFSASSLIWGVWLSPKMASCHLGCPSALGTYCQEWQVLECKTLSPCHQFPQCAWHW